jgi:hypothetical protein
MPESREHITSMAAKQPQQQQSPTMGNAITSAARKRVRKQQPEHVPYASSCIVADVLSIIPFGLPEPLRALPVPPFPLRP